MIPRRAVEMASLSELTTEVTMSRTDHRLTSTRRLALCVLAAVFVFASAPAAAQASTTASTTVVSRSSFTLTRSERTMLDLINRARANRGLARLRLRASLYRAARSHSLSMVRRDYFSHYSLDGSTVAQRARRAGYTSSGYTSWRVGEVIGWGSGSRGSAASVFRMWMNSSAHRKVLMGARWRDVGVGCVRGTYRGVDGVRMYTVDVGRRVR
jgi:uncharacterized protein YkwD